MMQIKIALGDSFLDAFASIPRSKQRKVQEFVSKFRHNPEAPGINYEKINDASDACFRSVRVDQDYRGIVLKPDSGNVYVLLWVDKHDDAYDWARRNRCKVNPKTGVLQLFESITHTEIAVTYTTPIQSAKLQKAVPIKPLFTFSDETFLRLGVPENSLQMVRGVCTENELEALERCLPIEAFEALYLVAAGTPLADVLSEISVSSDKAVDTSDYVAALAHPASQRRFHVVDDEVELMRMLDAPLERWRVFLHPSQRQLVDRKWSGPVRVLGGAGTGKTVVAMHRARWLAEHVLKEGQRLLFTTFTYNLAFDIQANLRKICSPEIFSRIDVFPINQWVNSFVKRHGYPFEIIYPGSIDGRYEKCWQEALRLKPVVLNFPDSFYREEWERVVLPQMLLERHSYLVANRNGRGVALNRRQRSDIWPVFAEMRSQLASEKVATAEDAMHHAITVLGSVSDSSKFRCVVVDEGQDLGSAALMLIRRLAKEEADDLFIVGDGHQRIYQLKCSLSQCGINIRGRGRKLRINYRTTEQIRRFATALLEGVAVDDMDDGVDGTSDYRSLVHGEQPQLYNAINFEDECEWIQKQVRSLAKEGVSLEDMCLVARTQYQLDAYGNAIVKSGIPVCRLSRDRVDDAGASGIRLSTMHRVKGLEFKVVLMAGINAGLVPLSRSVRATEDPTEKRLRDLNERALFHVAATRAIRHLLVSSYGQPSEYLVAL